MEKEVIVVSFTWKLNPAIYEGSVSYYSSADGRFGIDRVSRTDKYGNREMLQGRYEFYMDELKDLKIGTRTITDQDNENPTTDTLPSSSSSSTLPVVIHGPIIKSDDDNKFNPAEPRNWITMPPALLIEILARYYKTDKDNQNPTTGTLPSSSGTIIKSYDNKFCVSTQVLQMFLPALQQNPAEPRNLITMENPAEPRNLITMPPALPIEILRNLIAMPPALLIEILARVPRWCYSRLRSASPALDKAISSPDFQVARRMLGKDVVYVCYGGTRVPEWFCLHRKKDEHTKDVFSSILLPIDPQHYPAAFASDSATLFVGGSDSPGKICIINTQSSLMREEVPMPVPTFLNAALMADTLCLFVGRSWAGGQLYTYHLSRKTWAGPFPVEKETMFSMRSNAFTTTIDDSIYIISRYLDMKDYWIYIPKERSLSAFDFPDHLDVGTWSTNSLCVKDGTLYCYDTRKGLQWYDSKVNMWKNVRGVSMESIKKPHIGKEVDNAVLKEYYGNLILLWTDMKSYVDTTLEVWMSVITIERQGGEIDGRVETQERVSTLAISCSRVTTSV